MKPRLPRGIKFLWNFWKYTVCKTFGFFIVSSRCSELQATKNFVQYLWSSSVASAQTICCKTITALSWHCNARTSIGYDIFTECEIPLCTIERYIATRYKSEEGSRHTYLEMPNRLTRSCYNEKNTHFLAPFRFNREKWIAYTLQ